MYEINFHALSQHYCFLLEPMYSLLFAPSCRTCGTYSSRVSPPFIGPRPDVLQHDR